MTESSESLSRHEDEEAAERRIDEDDIHQDHDGALVEDLAHERLADAGEGEEGVLGEASQSHDGIEHVLVGSEGVNCDGAWEYILVRRSARGRME